MEEKKNYCDPKGYCTAEETAPDCKEEIVERCTFSLSSETGGCAYLAWQGSCLSEFARAAAQQAEEVAA